MSEDLIRLRLEADGTQVRGVFQDASASADGLNKTLLKTGEAGQVAGNEIAAGMEKAEYSMMEARHGAMLMSEELGVKMPRAVASLVASVGPLGTIMAAAFPIIGAMMLIDIVAQIVDKFEGVGKAAEEAEKKWKDMGFEMQESQAKANEELAKTISEVDKIKTPGAVGQLRALEDEMNQLSHASSTLGKSLSELINKTAELAGKETMGDKIGNTLQKIFAYIPGLQKLSSAYDNLHMSELALAEDEKDFADRLRTVIDADGNTAGLKAVDAELNKVYAALQKDPGNEPLQRYKQTLEGVQASLSSGIDNTFWKEQKVGAEEAVIKTKMLLDVHKLMRAAIAETGKLSEEQDKASAKLDDERLKKELDDEKKLNDSVLKVSESQLKLNLVQRESVTSIQDAIIARDLALGHTREAIADQQKLVSLLELEKEASLAIVDGKIAQAKAAMDVSEAAGEKEDYNNALADWTNYQADRVKVADAADKKISAAQVKMLGEEHKQLTQALTKFNDGFAQFFAASAEGHERLGKIAQRMYTSMANEAMQALAKKTLAMLEGLAIAEMTGNREKLMYAKKAAVAAYSAEAGIPVIGPALGAAAAATTFATLMAFRGGGVVPSAAGGMLTDATGPERGTIAMLHPNEMVLPAPLSQTVQDMAASATGAKSGGGDTHIHAMDAQSFERFLRSNPSALSRGIEHATDKGHLNIPKLVRGK